VKKIEYPLLILLSWAIGALISLPLVAFITFSGQLNFFQYSILPLALVWATGFLTYCALNAGVTRVRNGNWVKEWPMAIALILVARFAYRVTELAMTFPNLLLIEKFGLAPAQQSSYVAACLLALAGMSFTMSRVFSSAPGNRLHKFFQTNLPGFLIATLFFVVYFVLANTFNREDFNTNNVFFAADTNQWRLRLTSAEGAGMEMRAVHPLGFLLLRPIINLLSISAGTTLFHATVLIIATLSAIGIFLVWAILRDVSHNENFALLFAALLGVSTASLVFNSLIETYAFSGFLLILFFYLLRRNASFPLLAATGIAIFGITISNFAQSMIGFFSLKPRVLRVVLFSASVLSVSAALNLAAQRIYPHNALFFNPSDFEVERQHYQIGSTLEATATRGKIVANDVFRFSVVAPKPFQLTNNRDEGGGKFPKFYFMLGPRSSEYFGLGQFAAWLWTGGLIFSLATIAQSLRKEGITEANRLGLAFGACVAFNFGIHFFYGFEPFLYSADWTWALLLFTAVGARDYAEAKWLQATILLLLALLSLNNLSFIYLLMSGLAPFLPG
jgi:hypothetical protein